MDDGRIPAYCIILPKDSKEWPRIQASVKMYPEIFQPLQKFDAIQGIKLSEKELNTFLTARAQFELGKLRNTHEDLGTLGGVGCFLSHRALWQQIVEQRLPMAAIFEDDFVFSPKAMMGFNSLLRMLPSNWDMFAFGYLQIPVTFRESYNDHLWKIKGYFWGLQSYLLTYEGAIKLLQRSLPIDVQADAYIGALAGLGDFRLFAPKESITYQARKVSNIQSIAVKNQSWSSSFGIVLLFVVLLLGIFALLCQTNYSSFKTSRFAKGNHRNVYKRSANFLMS